MSSDYEDVFEMAADAIKEALRDQGHLNILIAGRTGVGKSTLINAMFNGNLAETGQGRPVTKGTREITKSGVPVSIWDTRGLEMQAFDETLKELERVIVERKRDTDPNKHLHVAWLCVQEDGRRVEEAEIALHEMLERHMPLVGVVTKARADQGFRAKVQELLPKAKNVVRIRAIREELDDGHFLEPLNLDNLVELTAEVLPEGQQRAFIAAQKASYQHKCDECNKIIAFAAVASGIVGAVPVPITDAMVLLPIQTTMLAKMSAVFGLDVTKGFVTTLIGVAGAGGATLVGRQIVTNLAKLVPGLGSVISGSTAAALTTALGNIYLLSLKEVQKSSDGGPPNPEAVINEFRLRMARKPVDADIEKL